LRELADALDDELAAGARRIVLDNTYLTRAVRSYVVEAASRHGVSPRCLWLDTPLAQAQVNVVERVLERFGSLPDTEELKALARREPGVLAPTSQMRTVRELEPPATDEGFSEVERLAFARKPPPEPGRSGVFVAAAAVREPSWAFPAEDADQTAPHLVFDWIPDGTPQELQAVTARLSGRVAGVVEAAVCPHPGGPPTCWCRPPLPGLVLAFARGHGVDPARSVLIGTAAAHRTLATTLGARYLEP